MHTVQGLFEKYGVGETLPHSQVTDAVFGYGSDPKSLMEFRFVRTGEDEITAVKSSGTGGSDIRRVIWDGGARADSMTRRECEGNASIANYNLKMTRGGAEPNWGVR